jgi:DNA-binding NarL/FixJ family response regulator
VAELIGEKTRILIADDHHMVRQGIRQLLECENDFEVVGETDNGLDAVRLAHELNPEIIIMEARMPRLSGVEATRRLKLEHPQAAVLILTDSDDDEYITGLIGAGATGYLLKSAHGEELMQAIRLVRAGQFVSDPMVAQKLYKRTTQRPPAVTSTEHMTHREMEVLKLVARGMNNRDIAGELGVGLRTVKSHLEMIFSKMGVNSRTEAVLEALKRGWVSIEDQKRG